MVLAVSETTLFSGLSSEFTLECDCEIDNSRIYCSNDNITWVETRGRSSSLDYVCVNSEIRYEEDSEIAFARGALFLANTIPSLENPILWLAEETIASLDSGTRQSTYFGSTRVVINVEEMANGMAAIDIFLYFN